MKIVKIIAITVFSIFATLYLAFLFVLPYSIDLNKYTPEITKSIQETSGLLVNFKGLKVTTSWNLSAGARVDKVDLMYPDGEKFAQINGLKVKLSLIPLLVGSLRLDSITAEKVFTNWNIDKTTQILKPTNKKSYGFKFSVHMPKISVDKYRISLLEGEKNYTIKGQNFEVRDFILNKKVKFKTNGNLILNGNKQISYDLSIFVKNFASGKNNKKFDLIKNLDDLYKYKFIAKIDADLKIDEDKINGKLNLDHVSFKISEKTFPNSTLKLLFKGDKAKINAALYTDTNSKILAYGWLKTGKNKYIDLQASTDKINIKNLLTLVKTLSNTFKIKDLNHIDADGFLKANFNIKSDFKKVKSDGYLKIKNANVRDSRYKVALNSINADIDFSENEIKIKKANALLNNQPIIIKGTVDHNANANLAIIANNLQLKGLLFASGNTKLLKENDILSGIVNLNASLQGRLDKVLPKINIAANNISVKNRPSNSRIKLANANISTISNKKNHANIDLTGLRILPNAPAEINVPKIKLVFDGKNLNIEDTNLYINEIKTLLTGRIINVQESPTLSTLNISIPNQISIPLEQYPGSNIKLKGDLTLNGDINNPKISGQFNIPYIRIPSLLTGVRNVTLKINEDFSTLTCQQAQIANSFMEFTAQLDNDFTNGITARNAIFKSTNLDINTLAQVAKQMPKGEKTTLNIINGKGIIDRFKAGELLSTGITNEISMDKNIMYAKNVRGEAYNGKIGGNISYEIANQRVNIDMQGRGLSANPALLALMGRDDDIQGVMDFDTNVSLISGSKSTILNSLRGNTDFIIQNGKMGILGKFEHLLYAQNVIANNAFKASLNLVAKAVMSKNTGVYKYMKGKFSFSNGWANIHWIKTSGPSMSLYLKGRYYLPDNLASITILGRISDDIVQILGPLGEFSMNKAISNIPQIGAITSFFASQFTTNPNYENISEIPPLSVQTNFKTKEFKVIIDGDVRKQSSVKSFKWLSTPTVEEGQPQPYIPPKQPQHEIPDFVKNLPDLKN